MPLPIENRAKIQLAVTEILYALGCNPNEGHFKQTPARVARMLNDIADANFTNFESGSYTTFPNEGYCGIVMCHHVPFYSFCAHHLLPFLGSFALGYLPGPREILGLSKLVRLFRFGSKKPTTQEELTQGPVDLIGELLPDARGVICYVDAEHTCMSLRGVQAHGARTTTVAYSGAFEKDVELRNQFLLQASSK